MVGRGNINALRALLEWDIHRRYFLVVFFLFLYTLQPLPLSAQILTNVLHASTVASVFSTLNNPAEIATHAPKITTVLSLVLLDCLFQDSLEKDNSSNLFPESSGYESLTSHERTLQQTLREKLQKTVPLPIENNHRLENARAETTIRYNNVLSASKKEEISENPYEEGSENIYEAFRYFAWNAKKFQDCQEQACELTVLFENDESSLSLTDSSIEENAETNLSILSGFQFMPDLTLVYNCDNNQWMIMCPGQGGNDLTYSFTAANGLNHDVELVNYEEKFEFFKCLICHCISQNPVSCCESGHVFCNKCMVTYREADANNNHCPSCREVGDISTAGLAKRMITNISVYCPGKDHGCETVTTIADLPDHYKACTYALVKCGCKGCEYTGMAKDVTSHSVGCNYREVHCEYYRDGEGCHDMVLFKDLKNHVESCSFVIVMCRNDNCGASMCEFEQEHHENTACMYANVPCPHGCGETRLKHELDDHYIECPEFKENCPYCGTAFARRTLEGHKEGCESRPEDCLICNKLILDEDWISHVIACAEAKLSQNRFSRSLRGHTECIKRLGCKIIDLEDKKQKLENDIRLIFSDCGDTTERAEEEQSQGSEQRGGMREAMADLKTEVEELLGRVREKDIAISRLIERQRRRGVDEHRQ